VLDLVAPANAVTFEFCVRLYDVSGWIGTATVYVDKAELCGPIPSTPTPTTAPTEPPTPEPTVTNTPAPTMTTPPEPTATFTPEVTATFTPEPTSTFTPEATQTPGACLHDGDVNSDGGVTPGDAQITFQYYLSCTSMAPTMEQYCSADFCGSGIISPCDGSVTPADAQGIMRRYLGYTDPCTKQNSAFNAGRRLKLSQEPGKEPGTARVQISLEGSGVPVSAFGIVLRSGPGVKLLNGVAGQLNPGWTMFKCVAGERGEIRIGALSVAASIGASQEGTLAELTISVPADTQQTAVSVLSMVDDLAGTTIK